MDCGSVEAGHEWDQPEYIATYRTQEKASRKNRLRTGVDQHPSTTTHNQSLNIDETNENME